MRAALYLPMVPALWLGLMTCSSGAGLELTVDEEELAPVVAGNNQFAVDLYSRLAETDGNLFFSPSSISTALAMTYAGAQARTRTQMQEVLRFPFEGEPLHRCFGALRQQMNQGRKAAYKLSVANRLWGQDDFKFRETFLKVTGDFYGAELAKVDFRRNADGVRKTINDWVAKRTEQKIQNLLGPGVVDALTRLILTNAIYFKGDWARAFEKKATRNEPFFIATDTSIDVPMMHQSETFRYTEDDTVQAIEMPYKGEELSMTVLLPKERDGLPALEQSLSADRVRQWLDGMYFRTVDVYIPKFKLEATFSLAETLKAMGMTDAFDARLADFSGMADNESLFISAVIHKAYVDVNEEGTEAAAATAVVMKLTSVAVREPPPVFRADHPFIFLIRDTRSGSILFIGRLANPA